MTKKNLIVASIEEEDIAYACGILTRFLRSRKNESAYPRILLSQPSQSLEELSEQFSGIGKRDTLYFLGDFFSVAMGKGLDSVLRGVLASGYASCVVYLNGSKSRPIIREIPATRSQVVGSCPKEGLIASLCHYCKTKDSGFFYDDILAKRKDDFLQNWMRTALNDFRLRREDEHFAALVRQLAENTDDLKASTRDLNGAGWSALLRKNPVAEVYFGKEDWGKLSGRDWCDLLKARPDFYDRWKEIGGWKMFSGEEWAELLLVDFQKYEEKCQWKLLSQVDGRTFVGLIGRYPEVLKKSKYDLTRLESGEWATLLGECPQFEKQCHCWADFSGKDWVILLSKQPSFFKQCNKQNGWSQIDSRGWCELLQAQSNFVEHCPNEVWKNFTAEEWCTLLQGASNLAEKCSEYKGWEKLGGGHWSSLLQDKPELRESCTRAKGWKTLDGSQWRALLIQQPIFEANCTLSGGWHLLSDDDWENLLEAQPKFEKYRNQPKLGGYRGETNGGRIVKESEGDKTAQEVLSLLMENPWLAIEHRECMQRFPVNGWERLLRRHPDLFIQCPEETRKKLSLSAWVSLLSSRPGLGREYANWGALTASDWCQLLSSQPQYALWHAEDIPWSKFTSENWVELLTCQPQMCSFQKLPGDFWKSLAPDQWVDLVLMQPQFMRREDFRAKKDEFQGKHWFRLLRSHPQLALSDKQWRKLDFEDWLGLLRWQAGFDDRFRAFYDFSKLTLSQWVNLLRIGPEFWKECPVRDKFTNDQWKSIILAATQWRRVGIPTKSEEILSAVPAKVLQSLQGGELETFLLCHLHAVKYVTLEELNKVSPLVWARVFVANDYQLPATEANFARLDGSAWSFLLIKNKEYCSSCEENNGWEKFNGGDWSKLLARWPDFEKYCGSHKGWELLDGYDWYDLLVKQPQFAEKCDWKKLSREKYLNLLLQHPEVKKGIKKGLTLDFEEELALAEIHGDKFPLSKSWDFEKKIAEGTLSALGLARILILKPELEGKYVERGLFKIFGNVEWYDILQEKPAFAKYCDFELLSPKMRLACLSQEGVCEALTAAKKAIPWPEDYEVNKKAVISYIRESNKPLRTLRDGKWTLQLIVWGQLTKWNREYASCCPRSQWGELSVCGWKQLVKDFLPNKPSEQMTATQQEQLWIRYSEFLRLPQERLDAYKDEDEEKFNEIRGNAVSEYRAMLVGEGLRSLREQLRLAAKSRYPVLILGESGTGKENAAKMLAKWSGRDNGLFEAFNCAASNSNLIESTLFGHTKGAFTGATCATKGVIEKANKGTLFFDEVAEFPLETQAKLLRVMQWRSSSSGEGAQPRMVYAFRPVGGEDDKEKEVDVRIVAATNKNLEQMIAGKSPDGARFRQDLYYRLNTIVIKTVPLREHKEDIGEIANLFWRVDLQMPEPLKPEEIEFLKSLDYPANVRQLQQLLIQYSIFHEHRTLEDISTALSQMNPQPEDATATPPEQQPTPGVLALKGAPPATLENTISILDEKGSYKTAKAIDKEYARMICDLKGGNQAATARALGVTINTLRSRLK